MKINVVTLCSGVDSQCMALERVKEKHNDFDYDLIAWSEIDKDAIDAHNRIFPQFKGRNVGDMSKADWSKYNQDIDLLTYSTPCTDVSKIGHLEGFDKDSKTRSSVLWSTVNAIEHLKPKFLMMENVQNIVSPKYLQQFLEWCSLVESYGYKNYYKVLDSLDYGVPQRRKRLFMISVRNDVMLDFKFSDETVAVLPLCNYVENRDNISDDILDSEEEFNNRMNDDMCPDYSVLCDTVKRKKVNQIYKIISWSRDAKGNVLKYNLKDVCNTLTAFGAGNNWNTTPHILDVRLTDNGETDVIMRRLSVYEMFRFMDFPENVCELLSENYPRMVCSRLAGNSIVVAVMVDLFERLFCGKKNKSEENALF